MTGLLLGLLVAHGALAPQAAASSPQPQASPKVTLEANLWTLDEVVREVGRQSRQTLRLAPNLASVKASVYVKEVPTEVLLNQLADVFRSEWLQEAGGARRLVQPAARQSLERAYLQARRESSEAALRRHLARATEFANLTTAELRSRYEEIFALARSERDTKRRSELYQEGNLLVELSNHGPLPIYMLSRMSTAQLERLWSGGTVWAIQGGQGEFGIPSDVVERALEGSWLRTTDGHEESITAVFLRRSNNPTGIRVQIMHRQGESASNSGIYFTAQEPTLDPSRFPFLKEVQEWPRTREPDVLATPIRSDTRSWQSPYWTKHYTSSDHLQWLHRASGVPIVAMATRRAFRWSDLQRSGRTVGDYVKEWQQGEPGWSIRAASGFLLLRPPGFSRLPEREIPEAMLRRLDAKSRAGSLTFEDLATLALNLSPVQLEEFTSSAPPCVSFNHYPLHDATPALRLWALLPGPLRAEATQPGGLLVSRMPPAARDQFQAALLDAAYTTATISRQFLTALQRGGRFGTSDGVLRVRTQGVIAVKRGETLPLDYDYTQGYTIDGSKLPNHPGVEFRLEYGDSGIAYTAELPRKFGG